MNEKKFAEIVKTTKSSVLSAIRKYLSVEFYHSIDDVAQETYVRAYKGLIKNRFKEQSSINTWLYTIAKNESLRMNEKLKKEEEKFEKMVVQVNKNIDNERRNKYSEETSMDLRDLITGLPDKYRTIMELSLLGYNEKQIADQLDIKRGTVKSRTSRGKELMQRMTKGGVNL